MMPIKIRNFPNEADEGESLDQLLQKLVFEAQKHPSGSIQRQNILNRLMELILNSNRLGHPQQGAWASNLYKNFYNEALQRTLLEICSKIERYKPEHEVLAWVNFCLNNNFKQVVRDYYKYSSLPSLEDLEREAYEDESLTDAQLLSKFLEEDPENLLRSEHLREHPQITFQYLAIARYVNDRTWEDLAQEHGISLQTLCGFFNRRLRKLTPYFLKYLQ